MTSGYHAYWISPAGESIGVVRKHIDLIVHDPKKFGFSSTYVRKIFQDNNEPPGFEGKARQVLMAQLIRQGWIRLRFCQKPYGWRAQVAILNTASKGLLIQWAKTCKIGKQDKHMQIFVMSFADHEETVLTISEMLLQA
jgi:hypothetical protein